ncbi:MAG: transglycosylase domain-containing protein [Dehalococcoidia bacterium]
MSVGRSTALRRRMRRRMGAEAGGGGAARGFISGMRLLLILGVLGAAIGIGGVGFAAMTYTTAMNDVVPPDQLLARYSRGGARIYDRHGELMYEFVDELSGLRRPVKLDQISPWLTKATISVEDPDFEENVGVNYRGLARAAMENFTPFGTGFLEGSGGSSITQQLAKNVYIPREERTERSVTRKIKEAAIAIELTNRYSKDQILEWYVNSISYGGLYVGIEAASEGYFGKPAKELTLPEAALLAGIPQSPARYDPFSASNLDSKGQLIKDGWAKWRQGEVLGLMVRRGVITQAEADAALDAPLQFKADRFEIEAPHFVLGRIAEEIRRRFGERALRDQGLEVVTTLDLKLQHRAEEIINETLTDYGDAAGAHNGAFLGIDPKTGQILAYVGSRDYFNDEIEGRNDNVVARNSPGSTLKPFTYMTALMNGWGTRTTILDTPVAIADPSSGGTFTPRNPNGGALGLVAADKALGNSLNISAIKTILAAGVDNTISTLKKVGFTTFDNEGGYGPALTTGGSEITLMDQTIAYGVLATNGLMRGQELVYTDRTDRNTRSLEPIALLKVTDSDKKVLYEYKQPVERRVIPAEYAWLITSILSDGSNFCITYGVCGALALPNGYPSAAKTGTSEPYEDLRKIGETWTAGYTPELVSAVWAGNSDNAPITGIDSTTVSLRSWKLWMVDALKELDLPPTTFTRPSGIVEQEVCWPSGKLPTETCPQMNRFKSLYAAEQIPSDPKDREKVSDTWWQKIRIDTRTGLRATEQTPPTFVQEEVRLVLPPEEVKGWTGLQEWAARAGILSLLAPDEGGQEGSLPALITSPQAGQGLSGSVTVIGRADSPDFQRYTLEWGRGPQPTSWVHITSAGARVPGGSLGTWDVSELPNGAYTLRVRLEDTKLGTRVYAVPVSIGGQSTSDSAPTLIVTAPRDGTVLAGSITINGLATSGQFREVRTEIGVGLNPDRWIPVDRKTTPILNSTIASWNTLGVDDGAYTLRITLVDSVFGDAVTRMTVVVRNKPDATPTPRP